MMRSGFLAPQASHSKLSHRIDATSADMINVQTELQPWTENNKAALINNYGASGSNAAMVVAEAPSRWSSLPAVRFDGESLPFWISGYDARSIKAYCAKLAPFVESAKKNISLTDLCFNLSRQSNRTLPNALQFRCSSVDDFLQKISADSSSQIKQVRPARPVVLCFGGQSSTFIGLDPKVSDNVPLFRHHLEECDAVIQSLGHKSIFPNIYSKTPEKDTVHLQTMLFSIQYASARCWMDCGVPVKAVVGHSFGEITALCISETLSLKDAIILVAGRAAIVRDSWGSDQGVMVAVEGDLELVERLVQVSNQARQGGSPASIACYNSSQGFTLAGSQPAMDQITATLASDSEFAAIKSRKLNVTNAFHSALVDPLIQSLEQVGEKLTFCKPKIRLERATETSSSGIPFTSRFVPDHMRNPVFFHHAVQRLAQDYPSAIWLEAGSAAKITSMARRSVGTNSGYHFQGISLTDDRGVDQLTDTTLALWKEGLSVTYWAHYGAQAAQSHKTLLLPPYQFEKNRHWLDVKPIPLSQLGADLSGDKSGGLWTFMGYQDSQRRSASFKINTESERYKSFIMPHVAAQTASICPATLEYSMAIEALLGLLGDNPAFKGANLHPAIRNMRNEAPLCVNSAQSAWLELQANDDSSRLWSWKIVTTPAGQQPDDRNVHETMMCVEGEIEIFSGDASTEFSKFEQLATHKGCVSVLEDDEGADCGLQGRSVYRSLADVVDYGELYRRVRRVTGRGNESAGTVHSAPALAFGGTWLDDLPAIDSFSQVAGLWVNCMADRQPGSHDMFLATGCEVIMSAPGLAQDARRQPGKVWHVWAKHSRKSDRAYTTDVFVFDSSNGRLVEVFLGIQYSRIPKHSMSRVLVKLTEPAALLAGATLHANHATVSDAAQEPASSKSTLRSSRQILKQKVKDVISNVSGVDSSEINDDSELANLGIDSLAGMELARELEGVFQCHLDQAELLFAATSFQEFVTFVTRVVNGSDDEGTAEEDDDSASSALNSGDVSPNNYSAGTSVTHACSSIDGQSDDEAPTEKTTAGSPTTNLGLGQAEVLAAFAQVKASTDQRIKDAKLDDTDSTIVARSNRLCVALVVEAFEQLGCSLQKASPGQILERITHPPQHTRLVEWLYNFLERDARLIDIDGGEIKRTHNAVPRKSSETIFQELLQANDRWVVAHKVANYAGKNLADVVSGKKDGIHVLFGSPEGRDLVRGLYCDLPFNKLNYEQMRDTVKHIIERLPTDFKGPLRILEMGAGTGGTTYILAPYLATLDINVEYTFTDLSPSMVAQARRTFGKQYPFMRFGVHDIEKSPVESLCGNQHVVIASNAVHATADLVESSSNIRKAMHPDGILMLTEMTEGLPFVDLVFGLLEGWWRFADDRTHAIVPAKHWESRLQEAGYGHVDWTDGALPENRIQKVIFALAGKVSVDLSLVNAVSADVPSPHEPSHVNAEAREAEANKYVAQYSAGFAESLKAAGDITSTGRHRTLDQHDRCVVIITGATGSLGSHLVARFAEDPSVDSVVCINRTTNSGTSALQRQQESLSSRKVTLSSTAAAKLRVFATDTALPQLGLSPEDYTWLAENGTHIVHNAWPMSASRPLRAFQPQLQSLRRLLDLASDISGHLQSQSVSKRVCFQFVSSIGAVGLYQSSNARIPEERLSMSSVLPNGYCEAKWVCERLLDETLHRFPDRFRAMVIRPGQIAGSSVTGVWNPVEHFAFLIKSAQSLRSFPAFEGVLQWIPADAVASTLADLALNDNASEPAYHIDNPTGQPWNKMSGVLAEALNIPRQNLIPFSEWIRMVKRSTLVPDTENPALRLVEFLEKNFERMSCGGVILDTSKARQHSPTLAAQGPVSDEVARRYVSAWKEMGFLRS
jgi:thioester reductase-like protein/malonyl CoA-acyl carrier protein transacylase